MSSGRTSWWAKDSAWWRREAVVELLEDVGLAGPAVVDWLACEAKAQNAGGVVKAGERTIARGLGIDLVTVGHALSAAVTVGLLDDFEREGRTFTCRISGWKNDQEKALGAARKARSREILAASHALGRSVTDVTECPPTGQDRTVVGREEQSARDRAAEHTQHAALPDVLDVLHDVDDLTVDPLPVLSTLAANAWATDEQLVAAAHHVAAWAQSPTDPPRVRDAGTLLRSVLQRAARDRLNPPGATGRQHLRPVDAQEADDAARLERLAASMTTTTEGAA